MQKNELTIILTKAIQCGHSLGLKYFLCAQFLLKNSLLDLSFSEN